LDYNLEQIVVSNGAKHAISNVLFSLINPEDEVIIFSPFWVSYPEMVKLSEGIPVIVKFKEKNGFRADFEDLENKITSKTKCIILNSPTNPTGVVWSKEELEKLLYICLRNKLFLISDEVYEHIVFEKKHISFASLSKKAKELTITVGSVSKSYAMTGWRIGWLAAPIEIANSCANIQSQQTSNPCSISQRAAVKALKDSSWIIEKKEELKRRRNYLIEGLSRLGFGFVKPQGAFYVFCNISKFGLNSMEFSKKLLEEKLLGVIPGRPFGEDGYIRISFSASFQEIEEGLQRLEEFVSSL
jgi:aspartate aminotransferase